MDFRSTLISMGRATYMNALSDPETLADTNIHPDWAQFEGYQYVPSHIWREHVGEKDFPPDPTEPEERQSHPQTPAGERFVEWELSKKLPRLAEKFGFLDSRWEFLREEYAKLDRKRRAAEEWGEFLLRRGVIPASGLIPPFRLLRGGLEVSGLGDGRPTVNLDEEIYWAMVVHLENLDAEKVKRYPHVKSEKLEQDLRTKAATLTEWRGAAA